MLPFSISPPTLPEQLSVICVNSGKHCCDLEEMQPEMTTEGNRCAREWGGRNVSKQILPIGDRQCVHTDDVRTPPHGPLVLGGLWCGLLRLGIRLRWEAARIHRGLSNCRIHRGFWPLDSPAGVVVGRPGSGRRRVRLSRRSSHCREFCLNNESICKWIAGETKTSRPVCGVLRVRCHVEARCLGVSIVICRLIFNRGGVCVPLFLGRGETNPRHISCLL
jgi:hypothetical protein